MRISCEYKTDKFPLSYQMLVVSLIKQALKNTDINYFKKLYIYDNNKSNKKSKDFCFSVFMKGYEKKGDIFIINDKIIINFSSPDYEFIVNLYNGLLKSKHFKYKNFDLNKVRINLIKEKCIDKSEVTFNTLSPIHIKDKNNNALEISDKNFVEELNYIVNKTLYNYRGFGLQERINFIPAKDMKKRVVKQEIRAFKKQTNKSYFYVNSYTGQFILQGNVNDLRDIYMLGIGFKRNQGFGMIEVV